MPPPPLARLGFGPPRRIRLRKGQEPLTVEQLHERDLERAFRCGARYARSGWRRRPPPRYARYPVRHPDAEHFKALCEAFHRGHHAWTRARQVHEREWNHWPEIAHAA